jgi:hypothetical protein
VARWVKIVELPGAREGGGDLTDWLEDGHTAKELAEVIKGAPVFSPEDETPWPDPRGLDVSLPPVEPFSAGMLPPPLGEHAVEAARRMDAIAPDFVAAPLLVAAGTVLGRKVAIRPKARDDWEVVPNLWGANIGQPSSGKTPGQKAGLKPLEHLNTEARRAFEQRAREHGLDKIERQQREADLRSKLKEAVKNNNPAHVARAREELLAMEEVKDPTVPRLTTSDATIERLAELLIENPNGILNARDELSGWLKQLEKGGHEGDRAFFIESWDGLVPYEVDRIGRGSIYVPALCLSIFGGIQPGPLMRYVGDALEEGEKADGLLQRFQVLVWPDPRPYNRSDEAPIPATRDAVMKVFRSLRDLDVEGFGAKVETIRTEEGEEVQLGLPYLRFSADAQAIYDQWRDGFEPEVRSGAYPAAAESHFIKYRSLFPTLALIFEAMEYVSTGGHQGRGEVSAKNAARAQLWCEYLKGHALRLYHPAIVAPAVAAQALLDKIEAGSVKHRTKVRELHRKQWEGLRTPETVDEAIVVLEAHGWVRRKEVRSEGRGRPSEIILLHPDLRGE